MTDILPHGGALSGSRKGYIDSQETFDAYPWESVKELYINRFKSYFDALAESMTDGMKAIGGVGNGVFEIVQDLVGYENLCIFFEEPELYASLFEKVGQILYEIWQWFLKITVTFTAFADSEMTWDTRVTPCCPMRTSENTSFLSTQGLSILFTNTADPSFFTVAARYLQ